MKQPTALLVAIAALLLPLSSSAASAAASELPACGSDAAAEYGVPAKVFEALAGSYGWHSVSKEAQQRAEDRGEYGPMALGEYALAEIAQNIGTNVEALKNDPCENYRGAAWWLMNPAGGSDEDDIWVAVNRYFYGNAQRHAYPETERVKAYYESL